MVIGFHYLTAVKVAFAVGDMQLVALAETQHPHDMATLFGIEGAEASC